MNDYHLKTDSLILSAHINEQRLETIELSLLKITGTPIAGGLCNENTEYHNRIIRLVKKKHAPHPKEINSLNINKVGKFPLKQREDIKMKPTGSK